MHNRHFSCGFFLLHLNFFSSQNPRPTIKMTGNSNWSILFLWKSSRCAMARDFLTTNGGPQSIICWLAHNIFSYTFLLICGYQEMRILFSASICGCGEWVKPKSHWMSSRDIHRQTDNIGGGWRNNKKQYSQNDSRKSIWDSTFCILLLAQAATLKVKLLSFFLRYS